MLTTKMFQIFSTERSGHHSIQFWLLHQNNTITDYIDVPGSGTFFYDYPQYQALLCDDLDRNDKVACKCHGGIANIDLQDKDRIAIFGHERDKIELLTDDKCQYEDYNTITNGVQPVGIVALRDFTNTMASLMDVNGQMDVAAEKRRGQTWEDRAQAILNKSFYFINYNLYNHDINYRQQICQDLNLDFTDIGIDYITPQANGSSFTGRDPEKFQRHKLNKRYEMVNQDRLKYYLDRYPQCVAMSQQIFGDV